MINVYCTYDELVDITTLVPNPRNPNKHPKKRIELLAKIIKSQGWRASITVNTRSGFVVRGHGTAMVAFVILVFIDLLTRWIALCYKHLQDCSRDSDLYSCIADIPMGIDSNQNKICIDPGHGRNWE